VRKVNAAASENAELPVPSESTPPVAGVVVLQSPARDAIAEKWNSQSRRPRKKRSNYWQFPEIVGALNMKVCGESLPGVSQGMAKRLSRMGRFARAVSVGCGTATKERNLLLAGIVERFDLFDLADVRLAQAQRMLTSANLDGRVTLTCDNAFRERPQEIYDLVYWQSSLHHMLDAYAAVQWSYEALKPGGVFAMWEYTGPTRWQWTERNLENVNAFRRSLPPKLRPENLTIKRPSIAHMMKRDPSEAADSANILPAVAVAFPHAEVIDLGGALYIFGLGGIWPKIKRGNEWLFDLVLAFDQAMIYDNLATCAFARKE
jgi:SAM-dependent methyltransferase